MLTVLGVYLPHESHKDGIELYIETLHELQGHIDKCGTTPYVIVGDYNTRLPQAETLSSRWYHSGGFNRSGLLYEFLSDNDLFVANFSFTQTTNYTFKNHCSKSYIDHVIAPISLADNIINCKILCEKDNVSDHLPLSCHCNITVNSNVPSHNVASAKPKVDWYDHNVQNAYR